jgi:hypothetical protein
MAFGHRAFEKVEMLSSRTKNDSSCLIGCLRTARSSRLTVSGSMEPSMLRLILWSLSPRLKGERLIEFLLGCELIIGFERRKSYRETTVEKRVLASSSHFSTATVPVGGYVERLGRMEGQIDTRRFAAVKMAMQNALTRLTNGLPVAATKLLERRLFRW